MGWNVQQYLLWAGLGAFTLYCLSWLWKRRWFYIHSWNVPGPLALPFVGIGYKFGLNPEDAMGVLLKIAEDYPSPVKIWLGPRLMYCIIEPSHVEQILTNACCLEKDYTYEVLREEIGEGLLTAPVPKWKRHRKIIMPSFNQKVLESYIDIFVNQTSVFVQIMDKRVGKKDTDIIHFVAPLFLDIICNSIMGLEVNAQGGNDKLIKILDRLHEIQVLKQFSILGFFNWVWKLHPLYTETKTLVAEMHGITQTVIKRKKELLKEKKDIGNKKLYYVDEEEKPSKKIDFLDLLLEHSDFSERELQDEVEIFISGGYETTTKTSCYLLEMLALFPEVQQKVYEEVIEVLGQHRDVEAADLPELKYMERVIKETMRLFPIGIFFARKVGEDINIGKYTLSKGVSTFFSTVSMHMNPKYWTQPLKFDPDRFLPEEVAKRHPCCYIPFSYGPRGCIGSKFAMFEMKSFVAVIIRRYKFFTQYKSLEDVEVKTSILSLPKNGFKVYLEYR